MIATRTNLFNLLGDKAMASWKLYDKDGKNLIDEKRELAPEIMLAYLEETLNNLEDTFFILEMKDNPAPAAKPFRYAFRNRDANQTAREIAAIGNAQPQANYESQHEMARKIAEELFAKYKAETELENLRKENKLLSTQLKKQDNPQGLERIISQIGAIVQMANPNALQINGIGTPKTPPTAAEQEKLEQDLGTFMKNIENTGQDVGAVMQTLSQIPPEQLAGFIPYLKQV